MEGALSYFVPIARPIIAARDIATGDFVQGIEAVTAATSRLVEARLANLDSMAPKDSTDKAPTLLRAADGRPGTNPKVWTLDPKYDNGSGVSTFANPPVQPDDIFSTDAFRYKDRVVHIPSGISLPPGVDLVQTEGTTGNSLLDANHWELRHTESFDSLPWAEYMDYWNKNIAPEIAKLAKNWLTTKK